MQKKTCTQCKKSGDYQHRMDLQITKKQMSIKSWFKILTVWINVNGPETVNFFSTK